MRLLEAGPIGADEPGPHGSVLTRSSQAMYLESPRVHDRMPVVLPHERLDQWLEAEPAEATVLIGPASEDALVARAVSKHVNSVKHDDETCIAAAPREPERGQQRSLF